MLELDHIGLACRRLPLLLDSFSGLGFRVTEPAELMGIDPASHAPTLLGQTSAHIVFENTYIELTAVPDSATDNHLQPFLRRHSGMHILALRGTDIDQVHRRVLAGGMHAGEIQQACRLVSYGQRRGEARFRWFMLTREETPEGLVCVVANQTPEIVYQPEVQEHPNGAVGLTGMTICTDDLTAAVARYAKLLGVTAENDDGIARFELINARLTLCTPEALQNATPEFAIPTVPAMVGLEVATENIADAVSRVLPPPANVLLRLSAAR
jgi:catechol 2,3-dioxygenase-like lactoylglutathione lyase family enzyme